MSWFLPLSMMALLWKASGQVEWRPLARDSCFNECQQWYFIMFYATVFTLVISLEVQCYQEGLQLPCQIFI